MQITQRSRMMTKSIEDVAIRNQSDKSTPHLVMRLRPLTQGEEKKNVRNRKTYELWNAKASGLRQRRKIKASEPTCKGTRNEIQKREAERKMEETSRLRFSKVESVTWARYVAMLARERGSSHRGNDGTRRKKARGHQKKTRTEDDTKIEKYIAKEAEKGGL